MSSINSTCVMRKPQPHPPKKTKKNNRAVSGSITFSDYARCKIYFLYIFYELRGKTIVIASKASKISLFMEIIFDLPVEYLFVLIHHEMAYRTKEWIKYNKKKSPNGWHASRGKSRYFFFTEETHNFVYD